MEIKWIDLQNKSDSRGSLIIAEACKNIPFEIKRVYCLSNLNDQARGFHAHKNLLQVMVCLSGSCDVLLDNGKSKETIHISNSFKGLFIDKMIWHEMHNFTNDCVLMVLSSEWYDEDDYIRNYESFIELVGV